ncbi:TPA: hypothetical protein QCY05_003508 [Bacillus wiedmannii]|nr:hypothetical protein [Bacillus wiedmannii]
MKIKTKLYFSLASTILFAIAVIIFFINDTPQKWFWLCIFFASIFVANKALSTHGDGSKYLGLFKKRKLFSRIDFKQFILKESVLLGDRERYYLNELSAAAQEKLGELAKNQEKKLLPKKCMKL